MRLFHAEPGPLLHQLELALGNRSGRALSCHQYTIVDLRGGLLPSLLPATKRRHEACDERIVQIDTKVAQASASWLTGGFFQRQIVPQAAPSSGQPRPISRLGRVGTQATPGVL